MFVLVTSLPDRLVRSGQYRFTGLLLLLKGLKKEEKKLSLTTLVEKHKTGFQMLVSSPTRKLKKWIQRLRAIVLII
jgi:hypothetical protein